MGTVYRSVGWRIIVGSSVLAVALVALPRAAESDLPMAKPETVGVSTARLERVRTFMKEFIDTNRIAGGVTLIARKGKVVHYEAHGWRDKEANQPMVKDGIFTLQSMTKPIVSTALMMLWEDGKFMLDDPISKWLPSYANKQVLDPLTSRRTPARPVTVRHILSHTSGLSLTPSTGPNPLTDGSAAGLDADGEPIEPSAYARAERGLRRDLAEARLNQAPREGGLQAEASAPGRAKTLLEAVERAAGSPLAFQPGERWQYGSSTDFVAILVE